MYSIHFVGDEALPAGQSFMLVSTPDGAMMFYRESELNEATLEASWAAYRAVIGYRDPDPVSGALRQSDAHDPPVGSLLVDPESRAWAQAHLQLVS